MIHLGDKIPSVNVSVLSKDGEKTVSAHAFFAGKKVVLFAVPGAFTPTCSQAHLPGFVLKADEIIGKGVDMIACLAVNDACVMRSWGAEQNADNITMIADGGAALTKAMGLVLDTGDFGGIRSQRYSMIINDGIIEMLNVEEAGQFEVSSADGVLAAL